MPANPTPPRAPKGKRREPAGPIRADESYPLADFLARAGWRKGALASAKRDGLIVRRAGGRSYVIGADWLDYLRRDVAGGSAE